MMHKTTLWAKLHNATVTHKAIEYDGSCGISKSLMKTAGIDEFEQLHVYNINNGARFITYAIPLAQDGQVHLYGAAARCGEIGDRVIIVAYRSITANEQLTPKVLHLQQDNTLNQ